MQSYYLAVDIGASSGRHILGHLEDGNLVLEEVYRFENSLAERKGHLCWDLQGLFGHIVEGIKACRALGKLPESMGIDTWGVDFVLLDAEGNLLGDTVAYRDSRTDGMDRLVEALVPPEELYSHTGTQKQGFNTIYQLMAVKQTAPEQLENADRLLMVPEYLNFLLTGKAIHEYTVASTTGLLNAEQKDWDGEILERLGYPRRLFGALHMPGETLGSLLPEIQEQAGFDCTVMLPACHDTGSAFLAVPAQDETSVYISSGTWSLLGMENSRPVTTEASRRANFTNEGGYLGRYRYLQNIMGLWMIQSVRRNLDKKYSFAELEAMAREASGFTGRVDVNDPSFLAPDSMIDAVKAYCRTHGGPVPESVGEVMQCVYTSLASCYAEAIRDLETLTGITFTGIHIVGGGTKDGYLNELTARTTGLPVHAGPTEGTALGNLMVQMIASGEFSGLEDARRAVRRSFAMKDYAV